MEWLTDALVSMASSIISLFPESPFVVLDDMVASTAIADWLPYVNWFIPIGPIMSIVTAWLSAIAIYYIYQVVLRWIKVIE